MIHQGIGEKIKSEAIKFVMLPLIGYALGYSHGCSNNKVDSNNENIDAESSLEHQTQSLVSQLQDVNNYQRQTTSFGENQFIYVPLRFNISAKDLVNKTNEQLFDMYVKPQINQYK